MHSTSEHAAAAQATPASPERILIALRLWRAHIDRTTATGDRDSNFLSNVDQLAGETTARAITDGARRQKVAASAKFATIEPNAKSMNSIGTRMPPVTTYAT